MNKLILSFFFFLFSNFLFSQFNAYTIYSGQGKKTSLKKMLKKVEKSDVLFFGELHNNAIAHWFEIEILKYLDSKREVVVGAEMFERDNQTILDAYLSGEINAEAFDTLANLWKNYHTDYEQLVTYSKLNEIAFIATNVPRKYASMVYKGGFKALDSLSEQEYSYISQLPIQPDTSQSTYQEMMSMIPGHSGLNLVYAQSLKDATMAESISKKINKKSLFYHINGSYHSDFKQGIITFLKQSNSNLNISTIAIVSQNSVSTLEDKFLNKADYIICVDADMTNTY